MRSILLVEDSAATRAFARAVLESEDLSAAYGGITVAEASSGFDAMRLLPRGPYDLIVTDINMADINGLELIRFIRKSAHHQTTPLLVISSLRGEQDVGRGIALGANEYLGKPFTAEQFRRACERLLGAPAAKRPEEPVSRGGL